MTSVELRPYLLGDWVTVTIDGDRVSVVSHGLGGSEVERFRSRGYRPGLSARDIRSQAADVVAFAIAYVERLEEFDRSADDGDIEQEPANRQWWIDHGDNLTIALDIE